MKNQQTQKTIFKISKMDCPSEESLIRVKLSEIEGIKHLDFDIPNRKLTVFHLGQLDLIKSSISELKFGDELISNEITNESDFDKDSKQKQLLWAVLAINFLFFVIEMSTGLISKSMGLVADSLDMLADSFVYAISLIAVGGTIALKKRIAILAGYFQILLAAIGFMEVLRRFLGLESMPDFTTMIVVSIFALIANSICLYLLQKSKSKEAHIQATMIFTSNDVIINLGVITAGILVNVLNSNKPDLVIGAIVFIVVIMGARRILKLGK
jgi:Co/Zn/Cd efflux system component